MRLPTRHLILLLTGLLTAIPAAADLVALRAANGELVSAVDEGGGRLEAVRHQPGPWESFRMIRFRDDRVALQAASGEFVSAAHPEGRLIADRREIGGAEIFHLVSLGGDRVALRAHDGAWVSAVDDGGGRLFANRRDRRNWEVFELEWIPEDDASDAPPYGDRRGGHARRGGSHHGRDPRGDGRLVAFRTDGGYYLGFDPAYARVTATRATVGENETFELLTQGNGEIALRASNGRYVSAEQGGGRELTATRDRIRGWETFRLVPQGRGRFALQTVNGQFVSAENGGGGAVHADRESARDWETFALVELD